MLCGDSELLNIVMPAKVVGPFSVHCLSIDYHTFSGCELTKYLLVNIAFYSWQFTFF